MFKKTSVLMHMRYIIQHVFCFSAAVICSFSSSAFQVTFSKLFAIGQHTCMFTQTHITSGVCKCAVRDMQGGGSSLTRMGKEQSLPQTHFYRRLRGVCSLHTVVTAVTVHTTQNKPNFAEVSDICSSR